MSPRTATDVFWYYPNIVGYLRVLSVLISFYFAKDNWLITSIFYLIAFAGDVVDGYLARSFDQCSKFGGLLDMITDRLSTCGILVVLAFFYDTYIFAFIMLIVIDISSHWFHLTSVASVHHKSDKALEHRNVWVRKYYEIYPLFGYCCVGTELFYVLLYLLHFFPKWDLLSQICWYGFFPAFVIKQIINIAQLLSAMYVIAEDDANTINSKITLLKDK